MSRLAGSLDSKFKILFGLDYSTQCRRTATDDGRPSRSACARARRRHPPSDQAGRTIGQCRYVERSAASARSSSSSSSPKSPCALPVPPRGGDAQPPSSPTAHPSTHPSRLQAVTAVAVGLPHTPPTSPAPFSYPTSGGRSHPAPTAAAARGGGGGGPVSAPPCSHPLPRCDAAPLAVVACPWSPPVHGVAVCAQDWGHPTPPAPPVTAPFFLPPSSSLLSLPPPP